MEAKEDLRVLCEWMVLYLASEIYTSDCKVMHIVATKLEKEYFMRGKKLDKVTRKKDFAVMITRAGRLNELTINRNGH
jgi:hypothetical protein